MEGEWTDKDERDAAQPRKDPPLVLIVDDEKQLADLYADYLKDKYQVKTAYSGQEALKSVNSRVSVVLLDRNIPDLSGSEILSKIRQEEYKCRVAMVTSVKPNLDVLEMGFDEYVTKPALQEDLTETVEVLLARSEYDSKLQRYYALITKQSLLEREIDEDKLSKSTEYTNLTGEIQLVKSELDQIIGEFNDQDFVASFRNLGQN